MPSGPSSPPIDRIQQNLLAALERKLLNWLCAHRPPWVTPVLLTGLGMVGAAAIFACYAASGLHVGWSWLAIAGYGLQWFGASIDGSLSRFRHIERPSYGYLLLSIHAYLAGRVVGEFKLSYLSAGPPELRLLLIGMTLAMMMLGSKPGYFGTVSGFDLFVGIIAALLVVQFIIQTLSTAKRRNISERKKL